MSKSVRLFAAALHACGLALVVGGMMLVPVEAFATGTAPIAFAESSRAMWVCPNSCDGCPMSVNGCGDSTCNSTLVCTTCSCPNPADSSDCDCT